jgi:hypothetical protein
MKAYGELECKAEPPLLFFKISNKIYRIKLTSSDMTFISNYI